VPGKVSSRTRPRGGSPVALPSTGFLVGLTTGIVAVSAFGLPLANRGTATALLIGLVAVAGLIAFASASRNSAARQAAADRLAQERALLQRAEAAEGDRIRHAAAHRSAAHRATLAEQRAAAVATERDHLWSLIDAMDAAVVAADPHGRVVAANAVARVRYGVQPGPDDPWVASTHVWDTDGTSRLAPERSPLIRTLREGTAQVEFCQTTDGTLRWAVAHGRTVVDGHGHLTGAVLVIHDTTGQHEAEQANAELSRSVAQLEGFAGVVSHDLKSPLVAVSGYVQLLRHLSEEQHRPAEQDEFLAEIGNSVETMRAVIDGHLAYATAHEAPLNLECIDLGALVEDVLLPHLHYRRHAGMPLPIVKVESLPPAVGDRPMLRQVFDNLIGNALKYTHPGQVPELHITAHLDAAGWVNVELADRGIGVPEGQHEAIFARFWRAHRDVGYAGTGLGLSICHRIVQRHGGTIGCRPNPGGGTRFWLTLPSARATVASRALGDDVSTALAA
jgi:signal transduction histidine kinase